MRIVSLLAAATEVVAELGCLDQLVGCSHECDYPPAIKQLPVVSHTLIDTTVSSNEIDAQVKTIAHSKELPEQVAMSALSVYTIDAKKLQELQPELILTQTQCEVCAVSQSDVEEALQHNLGLKPHIVSLAPYRLQDIWDDVISIGKAVDREEQANMLVAGYQQRMERLKTLTDQLSKQQGSKPRVAMLEWLDPLMAAGNWVPELVATAGGENIFGHAGEHSPWLTWDALRDADPDIIVLCPCGYDIARTMQDVPLLEKHPSWGTLRAVREGHIYAIDGNAYINRSGPRLVESAEILGRIFYGSESGIEVDAQSFIQLERPAIN
ncbi:cobalamin-binding protein [Ktedonobacteria bacterium brp13]|nr:cobalamin-binding protein [Ktedonobacteria bacterium brp13]